MVKNMFGVEGRGYELPSSITDEEAESVYWQLCRIKTYISRQKIQPHSPQSIPLSELLQTLCDAVNDFDSIRLEFHLSRLPPELWSTVREYVKLSLDTSIERRTTLFRELRLKSLDDVLFLRSILCSRLSQGLRDIIRHLTIEYCAHPSDLSLLIGMLPSIHGLVYAVDGLEEPWHSANWNAHALLHWRHRSAKLHSLGTLTLRYHSFPSLSALLRLIASLRNLRLLELTDVTWPQSTVEGQYLSLSVKPGSVLDIMCERCPQDEYFLAAALVGYEGPRRLQLQQPNTGMKGLLDLFGWLYEMQILSKKGSVPQCILLTSR